MEKELTVEQKFARIVAQLRDKRPFYSAVYETIPHIETDNIETMGVTTNKLLYNKEFVDKLNYSEFAFVVLHEIAHISLMHVSRRHKRDPELYNIACDLYVNSLLAEEFNLSPGNKNSRDDVEMPKDCVYCSTLDLDKDYVEKIYLDLEKQGQQNGYFSNPSTLTDNNKQFKFSWKGSGSSNRYYGYDNNDKHKQFDITIVQHAVFSGDLIDDGSDEMKKENDSKAVLAEAVTRNEMLNKSAGNQPGRLLREVNNLIKSKLDWRKLLRKYCIAYRSTDTSFKMPDKRMFYQDAIYPGQDVSADNKLKNVKICIDTSGSISQLDLQRILGQVLDLLKQFKVTAELICWDAEAYSMGQLTSEIQIPNADLVGGGGTDPNCVFKYFESKDCKIKPFVTLIFTDAYFSMDNFKDSYKKKYKNTIWIMTEDHDDDFKPPFGKVAFAKFYDE